MSVERKVELIERRLENIENALRALAQQRGVAPAGAAANAPPSHDAAAVAPDTVTPIANAAVPSAARPVPSAMPPASAPRPMHHPPPRPAGPRPAAAPPVADTARVLGIGGVIALLVAASYLIRLALDSGWLTPIRQIGLAAALGLLMIGVGLALVRRERAYASLLPAGGLAVLYLTVYGAHNLYALLNPISAAVLIAVLSVAALALGSYLRTDIYALLAAVTSYSVPMLLPVLGHDVMGLALYFCSWSVVYTAYSILVERRAVYLIAMYLGMSMFAYLPTVTPEWPQTLTFQALQLIIFGIGATQFSIRTGRGMTGGEAAAHAPALLFFYAIQYGTLDQNAPSLAPIVTIGSALVVFGLYLAARRRLGDSTLAGSQLATGYLALVFFHSVFIELLEGSERTIVAMVVAPAVALFASRRPMEKERIFPIYIAAAAMGLWGYAWLIRFFATEFSASTLDTILAVVAAAELYAGYYFARGTANREIRNGVLYGAHVMAINACMLISNDRVVTSVEWAVLAFLTMWLGVKTQDRDLGRSSLLILGFLTGKMVLFDLATAGPIARIVCLVVLGIALYASGLVYQRKLAN